MLNEKISIQADRAVSGPSKVHRFAATLLVLASSPSVINSAALVGTLIAPPAGASELSPQVCEKEGSFTSLPKGYTKQRYEQETGSQITKVPGGYEQSRCSSSSSTYTQPVAATPATVIVTVPVPVPVTVPVTTPTTRPKNPKTTKKRAPKTTTTTTTTTTTLPKIIFNKNEPASADTRQGGNSLLEGKRTVPTSPARDRSSRDDPKDPQEPAYPNRPAEPIYTTTKQPGSDSFGYAEGLATKVEIPGGSPPEQNPGIMTFHSTQPVESSGQASPEVESKKALLVSAAQADIGRSENDGINIEAMPPGMSSEAWCAGIITNKWMVEAGIKLNGGRQKGGQTEVGALRLMGLFKNGDPNSRGNKHLSFVGAEDIRRGSYQPQPGDLVFWNRNNPSEGHVGVVSRIDPSTGKVKVISGNMSNKVKEVGLDADLDANTLGLKDFLGVGVIGSRTSSGPAQQSLTNIASATAPQNITIVVQQAPAVQAPEDPSLTEQAQGLGWKAWDTLPPEARGLVETVTGKDIEQPAPKPKTPPPAQGPQVLTIMGTPLQASTSSVETAPGQTQAGTENNPAPTQDEQLQALASKLATQGYTPTNSRDEFMAEYADMFRYVSKLTGAPQEFVAAHAWLETGGDSELWQQALNFGGIKVSGEKGCRLDDLSYTTMDTQEGTPGQADRRTEKNTQFCSYPNREEAARSYANLMLDPDAPYRFDGKPVDVQTALGKMGSWATDDYWKNKILSIVPDAKRILEARP